MRRAKPSLWLRLHCLLRRHTAMWVIRDLHLSEARERWICRECDFSSEIRQFMTQKAKEIR